MAKVETDLIHAIKDGMAKSVADGNEEIQGGYASNDGLSTQLLTPSHGKELGRIDQCL